MSYKLLVVSLFVRLALEILREVKVGHCCWRVGSAEEVAAQVVEEVWDGDLALPYQL